MASKKVGPPRPPLPSKNQLKQKQVDTKRTEHTEDVIATRNPFSIRYCRDDSNQSDEEISITLKEKAPVVQLDRNNENKTDPLNNGSLHGENSLSNSPATPSGSCVLHSLPFLPKAPNISNKEPISDGETLNCKAAGQNNSSDEIVFETAHYDNEANTIASVNSNEQEENNPLSSGANNPVIHSSMSLKSLLKKDVHNLSNIPKAKSLEDMKRKSLLASAIIGTTKLIMPFGVGDLSSEITDQETDKDEDVFQKEIPVYNILLLSTVVFLYFMLPSSSFVNGLAFGGVLMYFVIFTLIWILTPEMTNEERYRRDLIEHELEMEKLQISKNATQCSNSNQPQDLEGWFFKASDYNASEPVDFGDIDQVQPVYLSLESHLLTFSFPVEESLGKIKRSNMLAKNENIKFSDMKDYDLSYGGDIQLVPNTLTLKRLWARKYPIYLKLFIKPPSQENVEDNAGSQDTFVLPSDTEEIYLFSATGRAKEEWYYRMENILKPRTHSKEIENIFYHQKTFTNYMRKLIGGECEPTTMAQLTWVNALLGRLFWDVWKSKYWNDKMKNRLQSKISKIKLPSFIRYLKVTDIKLGNALPKIERVHNLRQDHRGIWVDLDVDYTGGIMLTIETMINLEYYLRQLTEQNKPENDIVLKFSREDSVHSDVSVDSDTEDGSDEYHSPSASSDGSVSDGENIDESTDGDQKFDDKTKMSGAPEDNQGWAGKIKNPKGKKIVNMLEKFAKSKWVQKAAESKVVQKAVSKLSNIPIEVSVEVVRLQGTLAANIPPPPSNRLWLGFHVNPILSLIARPKLGEKNVRLTQVTEWIEYKLKQEFKSIFVLPNMEDITIRIMDSGFEDKFPSS